MQATIWTQNNCKWCREAKALLLAKGYRVTVNEIGVTHSRLELLDAVPDAKTVPQIFLDGKHIGGYNSLKQLFL